MASYVELPPKKGSKLPRIKITVELGYNHLGKRDRRHKTVELSRLTDRVIQKAIKEFEIEVANKKKDYSNLTYAQAVELWQDNHVSKLSLGSRKIYSKSIGDSLERFGDVKIKDLRKIDFVEYKNYLIDNNIGDRKGKLDVCKNVLTKMVEWDLLKENPSQGIAFPRNKKEMDFYDEKEVNKLLEVLKTANKKHAMFIRLAVLSGMRHGEISALTIENVDFKNNQIFVKHSMNFEKDVGFFLGPTKNKKERTVPMPQDFMKEFKAYVNGVKKNRIYFGKEWRGIEGMNLVFCNSDGYPHEESLFPDVFKSLLKKHEFRVIRFHDLRHTHASLLLAKGVNMKVIQKRLGHASIMLTMDTYSHLTEETEQSAAEALNSIL